MADETSAHAVSGVLGGDYSPPRARLTRPELQATIDEAAKSPVVDALLEAVHGLVAVANENRQIVAVNEHMLEALGVKDAREVFGLRLGEVVHCVHSDQHPLGCGHTEFCSTCGAAIAQLLCERSQLPVERMCGIETHHNGAEPHLYFRVRVAPLLVGKERLLLIFLQDVTQEQRVALLERIFLHDLNNTATGLSLASSLLAENGNGPLDTQIVKDLAHSARRLTREIELQRCLAQSSFKSFVCEAAWVLISGAFEELERACRQHPASQGRTLEVQLPEPDRKLACDPTILHRILYNMAINALEATEVDETVRVFATREGDYEVLQVWNPGVIPQDVQRRIFRRNFSTKGSIGRGIGTYSIKLLGEQLLGGIVSFESSAEKGTTFRLALRIG